MTYQQRVEILRALPRGAKVTVLPKDKRYFFYLLSADGVARKIADDPRGMTVQFAGNKTIIGYQRLSCEKIKMVEEVADALIGRDNFKRKYPYSVHEAFKAALGFDPRV